MSIISNVRPLALDVISLNGEFMSILLVILLSTSFLILNTKYWNKYVSNIIDTCSNPLLLTFIGIVIFKLLKN